MSTLRELTAENHAAAENTVFMRLFMAKSITEKEYLSYLTQMTLVYSALEPVASSVGLLDKLPGISRLSNIRQDLAELQAKVGTPFKVYNDTVNYYNYIIRLSNPADITAHFYVRYAGDMFGGQMMKPLAHGSGKWYDFEGNLPALRQSMRELATPELAKEANIAFTFNIQILESIMGNGF